MADIDLQTLQQHSRLFSLLDEAGQKRILDSAQECSFADGEVLMTEGESGDVFYVVTDGAVRVLIEDGTKEVALLNAGSFVGEIAALVGEPRSATVTCAGIVEALSFDATAVKAVLEDYPKVREALVKLALQRSEDNLQQLISDD
jgi:CRP-like cAMP-binding protein